MSHADLKERLKNVPRKPGVYMYKDQQGRVIYVGKAKALRSRMRSYFQSGEKLHPKVKAMMNRVADFEFIVTGSEVEALILENNLIKSYKPRYNIDLRDDKTYPYLKISTGEKYPRVHIVREKKDGVSRYFGPYTDVSSLRETLKILNGVFPLRTCKSMNKARPCLNRDIGKCLAPCSGAIKPAEYHKSVEALIAFLEGNSTNIIREKEAQMKTASAELDFEKAARLRDQIRNINKISEKQRISFEKPYNLDLLALAGEDKQKLVLVFKIRAGKIIARDTFWLNGVINEDNAEILSFFLKQYYSENPDIPGEILSSYLPAEEELIETWLKEKTGNKVSLKVPRRGDKKAMLDMAMNNARLLWEEKEQRDVQNRQILVQLARNLEMEVVPARIECYDISHLGGEETVASMVVFSGGEPERKAYRRFKIKEDKNHDVASIKEALKRRLDEASRGNPAFMPEPDLIIVDGGVGQVNAAAQVLKQKEKDIPVFGLAEKEEEIFKPGIVTPLRLSKRDPVLMLLQRLRDEAHRFALNYNRQRRGRKLKASALDNISGIGYQRKNALLKHFGSPDRIAAASLEEISAVPGISIKIAQNIYNYYRKLEQP